MLLTNFENCRIGGKCEEGEGIKRSYLIVRRGKREGVELDLTGREAISVHDIGFLDVVGDVVNEIDFESFAIDVEGDTTDAEGVKGEEDDVAVVIVVEGATEGEIDGVANAINVEDKEVNEAEEVVIAIVVEDFSNFVCFVRTCSCSLMLLLNFAEQRLQTNVSVFSFAIPCTGTALVFRG